mgnify:CR=1 FL=1
MINFIVCDDEKEFRKKITMVINKVFMKNTIEYKFMNLKFIIKNLMNLLKMTCHQKYIY